MLTNTVKLLALLSFLVGCRGQFTVSTYVTAQDIATANAAMAKAESACAIQETLEIDDREGQREQLVDAAAGNILYEIMKESNDQAEFTNKLASELPGAMIATAAPLIMFFVILVFYSLFCCWTACPCCKCLRCCGRKRRILFIFKLIFLVAIGGMALALVVVSGLSTRGYSRAVEGFDVTNCAAAKMVNATFQGQASPYFLGLIPVLNIFNELEDSLADGSTFITDLRGLLTDTQDITDAVSVATATLDMLSNMLSDSRNTQPTGTLHECVACGPLATTLSTVSTSLSSGTAAALSAARVEVDNQLSGSSLVDIRTSLSTATAPLVDLKETIRSSFAPFVEDTLMETLSDQMNANGTVASVFMIGLALTVAGCALLAVVLWMCCDKKRSDDSGEPVHNKWVHRCACCTWCCGCYYTMLAFFLGGLLLIIAVPLSSMCLIMEDISSDVIDDISGALELTFDGPEGEMMGSMIDQCIQNSTANPRLLDLIYIDEPGGRVSMYDKLVTQTKEQITTQFDQIGSSPSSGGGLATSTEVVQLTSMLRDVPLDMMMLPLASIANDPTYQPMGADSDLVAFFATSASCTDETIPLGYGLPDEGDTVKGVSSFVTQAGAEGFVLQTFHSCARDIDCTAQTPARAPICAATAEFMNRKKDLLTGTPFTCRRFRLAGSICDVVSMAQATPSSPWTSDCLGATEEEYACSLSDFVTLVQGYEQRLSNVFSRLDSASSSTFTKIQTNLKNLLDQYFLSQIEAIGNGVTCGFMGDSFKGVVDGMCYGGVWGLKAVSSSYAACAVVTMFIVMLMYVQWRLAIDNVNSDGKILDSAPVVPM